MNPTSFSGKQLGEFLCSTHFYLCGDTLFCTLSITCPNDLVICLVSVYLFCQSIMFCFHIRTMLSGELIWRGGLWRLFFRRWLMVRSIKVFGNGFWIRYGLESWSLKHSIPNHFCFLGICWRHQIVISLSLIKGITHLLLSSDKFYLLFLYSLEVNRMSLEDM